MKKIMLSLLSVTLAIGVVLAGACASGDSARQFKSINPLEANDIIQQNRDNPDFVILDVRTAEEFAGGHLKDAVNIDFYSPTFRDELDRLDKSKTYLIYCRTGHRSGQAFSMMYDLAFRGVYNMLDGIVRWQSEGLPLVK